jgi:hypothetical protein
MGGATVRASHGVEVVLLHQLCIAHHRRNAHSLAVGRVVLVPVHPSDHQRLAVEQQLRITDAHAAHADPARLAVDELRLLLQTDAQAVAARSRACPCAGEAQLSCGGAYSIGLSADHSRGASRWIVVEACMRYAIR